MLSSVYTPRGLNFSLIGEWHGLKNFVVRNSTTARLGHKSLVMPFFSFHLDDHNGYIVLLLGSHIGTKGCRVIGNR